VADRTKLRLVLVNLLRNALEAVGPEGGRVTIAPVVSESGVRISVEDSGPGVPDEVRRRLFRPFSSGKASGTGLGLAVARKLALVHGGDLDLLPGPGGARFELFLPRALVVEGGS
jgi:signal transduction histidine kinase